MIVGRDPRFLGETLCAMAAEILTAHGITPLVIAEAAPTPAISYAVIAIEGGRSDQLHRVAQSAGIQRNQVLNARTAPGVARGDQGDRGGNRGGGCRKREWRRRSESRSSAARSPTDVFVAVARDRGPERDQEGGTAGRVRSDVGCGAWVFRCATAGRWRRSWHRARLSRRAVRGTCP